MIYAIIIGISTWVVGAALNAFLFVKNITWQRKLYNEREKFEAQSKGIAYKENMQYAFNDSAGNRYFYFPDLMKLPLPLLEKLNELQTQLNAKLPGHDLDAWIKKVKDVVNDENRKDKITQIGYWLGVLEDRRNMTFDPTVLTEIAALLYIREDENPCVYNEALHREKYIMLSTELKEGGKLYDFFQQSGLMGYIPSRPATKEEWEKFSERALTKIERFNSILGRISTSVSESEKCDRTLSQTS